MKMALQLKIMSMITLAHLPQVASSQRFLGRFITHYNPCSNFGRENMIQKICIPMNVL
jgi:hypothetical protein